MRWAANLLWGCGTALTKVKLLLAHAGPKKNQLEAKSNLKGKFAVFAWDVGVGSKANLSCVG